jgi:LPPG:FO 2-phospho-L-lactate transferase
LYVAERHRVTLLAGGFGGARMAHGFAQLGDQVALTVIGNTADDLELHGLYVSPDLDTVMYTLAGLANDATGWGVRAETWSAAQMLERYGEATWFRLGDRDLATHIFRTARLHAGMRLTDVTRQMGSALGVAAALLPMSDDPVRTKVLAADGWLDFQDYFVRRRHRDEVQDIRFEGVDKAQATPEVVAAIEAAQLIVIAPSNPFVSVAPILSVRGVLGALRATSATTVAISPIVGGSALRGPAAQILGSAGREVSASGIAAHYADRYPGLVDVLVIDNVDSDQAGAISEHGIQAAVTGILIADEKLRRELATEVLRLASVASAD